MSQENSVEAKVIWNRAQGLEPDRDFSLAGANLIEPFFLVFIPIVVLCRRRSVYMRSTICGESSALSRSVHLFDLGHC
jgi:hypothetical protein